MSTVRVLAVASELYPFVKTGGLADVTGALPLALAAENISTITLLPGYPAVLAALPAAEAVHRFPAMFGGPARLLRGRAAGLDLLVLDAPHLFARPGSPYQSPDGPDWPDNAFRFAALGQAAASVAAGCLRDYQPDVLHAHDWQAGLGPAYLHYGGGHYGGGHGGGGHSGGGDGGGGRRPGTVMTIHNLAFQGQFSADLLSSLRLPLESWSIDGVEFHGAISFLKAGLALSDRITTVSPTYAAEIRTPEGGMGFDGLLRARAGVLRGILNGIDTRVWNPATDTSLAARFDLRRMARRAANKAAVQTRFGLTVNPGTLLLGAISRLTWQKGLDQLLENLRPILSLGVQLAVLGSGDHDLEEGFAAAAAAYPGQVGCAFGYDEALAHQMQAGLDALLVPSRFEPCGLTQLCALRYGTVPIVARAGGLADTVIDANEAALATGSATGIQFAQGMLLVGVERAAALWRQPEVWSAMRRNAMRCDVSWQRPAARYAALYRELIAARAA